jgi:hypothetical protein
MYAPYSDIGFATLFSANNEPWPANPLSPEGFGHWFMRYTTNPTTRKPADKGTQDQFAVLEAGLGYGSVQLDYQYTSLKTPQSVLPLFLYDHTLAGPSGVTNQYLDPLGKHWTTLLDQTDTNVKTSTYATQNILALRLKNEVPKNPAYNWQFLVSTNFFRPRNWAFCDIWSLVTTSTTNQVPVNATGVPQQRLVSDQPNASGQYEFLVPDPYYAPYPVQNTIVGIPFLPGVSLPTSFDQPVGVVLLAANSALQSMITQHSGFHYWTFASNSQCILDLYINASKINRRHC